MQVDRTFPASRSDQWLSELQNPPANELTRLLSGFSMILLWVCFRLIQHKLGGASVSDYEKLQA
ncbi:hypothetical protein YC2023_094957 [Brassica napus]